jgi:hypothetical protein
VQHHQRSRASTRPTDEESEPRYLRAKDLQRRWKLSAAAVCKVLSDGTLRSIHIGSAVRVLLSDVEAFERAQLGATLIPADAR